MAFLFMIFYLKFGLIYLFHYITQQKMNRKNAEQSFLRFLENSIQNIDFKSLDMEKSKSMTFSLEKDRTLVPDKIKNQPKTSLKSFKSNSIIKKASELIKNIKKLQIKSLPIVNENSRYLQNIKQELAEEKIIQSLTQTSTSMSLTNTTLRTNRNQKKQKQYIFVNNQKDLGNNLVFKIIKFINQGFFGKVYLVQEIQSKCIYCIKILPRASITKKQEGNILLQIKIQSYLTHPNIIKLYHSYIDEENIYLLMEPFLGENLYSYIKDKEKNFSQKEVKVILKQIISGVQYMHKQNVVHRDIKPQNILYDGKTVKICDFGWSIYSQQPCTAICGTPLYTSPQVLRRDPYNQKVDIWSIGVLTYELLMKKAPFEIKTKMAMKKILNQEIKFPDSINLSPESKDFINKCTIKQPEFRSNISELKEHNFLMSSAINRCTIS